MDITVSTIEATNNRKPLRKRTYRSVQPGDIIDFGPGSEIQYREATGYGSKFNATMATVDVKVIGGVMPLWLDNSKFTIWRKR